MECPNCELKQRQFYCENCLKQHLLSFRTQLTHVAADRDSHIASSQRALLTVVEPARLRRADVRNREDRVREIWDGLEKVRKANEKSREQIQRLREDLASRRRTLATAATLTSYPISSPSSHSASPTPLPSSTSPGSANQRPSLVQHRISNAHSPTSPTSRSFQPFPSSSSTSSQVTQRSSPLTRGLASPSTPTSPAHGFSLFNRSSPPAQQKPGAAVNMDVPITKQIEEAGFRLAELADEITRARSGLVQELVEVFSVVEVGGRPPIGGKAGTKGEWTIGGLVLPVPGDMRRYPPDQINAVITHTLHFLSLLAFYLGVKLPFEVVWSRSSTPPPSSSWSAAHHGPGPDTRPNGLLGVGTPWIGATRGSENGGWARWSTKHPLHVSAAPPSSSSSSSAGAAAPYPSTSPSATSSTSKVRPGPHGRSVSTPVPSTRGNSNAKSLQQIASSSLEDSHLEEGTSSASGSSFTTALAMLVYDVCYLAHTQSVEVPLAQAGEILGNLWAVCCSPELGKRSHATRPLLPAPTQPTFPLDFAQLLQATAANPSRARIRATGGRERVRSETIVEEDDGWDLV